MSTPAKHARWIALARAAIGIGLLVLTTPVSAQNGASFTDASRAAVSYTETPVGAAIDCASLVLTTYEYSVISAQTPAVEGVPEHCRVRGVIGPEIAFEVNLPLRWNGRLYMYGNGGFAGNKLDARASLRNQALRHGFATVHTNTGHDAEQEPGASFAQDLQKTIDYAFRAVHLSVITAKQLAERFYSRAPERSYWDGCSNGGRQGLMSAQRFPEDFDGIVAGAPVIDFTGTMTAFLWNSRVLRAAPLSREKLERLGTEIYARCDTVDGLEDGLIDDPRRCSFDPAMHLPRCGSHTKAGAVCFTAEEIAALQKVYQGPRAGDAALYPGQPLSAEVVGLGTAGQGDEPRRVHGWEPWLFNGNDATAQFSMVDSFLKFLAFERDDPRYDPAAFRFDVDPPRMQATAALLNTTNPDLRRFRARGGKMLTYFGWADTALNPLRVVQYYESLERANGAPQDFYRLFMVPGMFHCSGGVGADRFDAITAVIDWVEAGKAPDRIVGQHVVGGSVKFSRPHCPYPQVTRYRGSGARDSAESFVCSIARQVPTDAARH